MSARFQVLCLPRQQGADPNIPDVAAGRRRFTWRFLAANNRSLAVAGASFPDATSCVAAIHDLKRGLKSARCELERDAKGHWTWSVRVDRAVVASAHSYPRQLRARMTCENFFELASDPAALADMKVVYR